MINAIIVDDEKDGAEVLQLLVEQHCPQIKVVAVAYSVEEATAIILRLRPDLVFLDIEMTTGTGFDVIQATEELKYERIFITAYEQYAIKAIKTNAADYILKPIDVDELVLAVKNVEKRLQEVTNWVLPLIDESRALKKISIPSQEGFVLVDLDDIIRLEADSNYTQIFLKTKQKLMVAKTLKSFEEQLPRTLFCRIHSAHLINLNEVERYIKGDGGMIILKDASSIPVSRSNKNELMARLRFSG
jgi:two-component system LytT family response regulator